MSSSSPGPLTVAVRRSWEASRYLLIGIGVAMLTYVGAFLVVAALLFAVAIIGLPALPEAATLLRRAASAESRRAAARLGPGHRPASYPPLGGGELPERVRRTLTDRTTWRLALWLPLQTLFGMGLGYLTMILWPVALLVDGIALSVVGPVDRRRADEYGTEPPERPGWALRWHPVLADLSAGWTMALLAPPPAAELTERIAHLTESRAGAVAAHGAELRRIERDLHDGAQARIVALSMRIGLAKQLLDRDPAAARARLDEAQDGADAALAELRHVVRGIHPPVLTDRGLAGAVRALAADVAVPVTADLNGVEDGRRLPAAIEAAAYFVVAEALTNISKHSGATAARVRIDRPPGLLRVTIGDDG
ncbi:histidine kinase, partial [Streptomyces sp. WAC00303]|uniref:sensor histidine kinase n=1 Tax=Streptomyces sp. WAC00303 TaxID=2933779 RepID=UPI00204D7FFC